MRYHCHRCGIPLRGFGELAVSGTTEQTSQTHQLMYRPKIKGRKVEDAASLLRFMPQHAARDVAAVLKSATANAENNHNLSAEDLVVVEAHANEGPTIKRWRPRAQNLVSSRRRRIGRG